MKRQNESSQIKKEDYEKQMGGCGYGQCITTMDQNNGYLYDERASQEEISGRLIVRANRGVNRSPPNTTFSSDH